MLTVVVLLSVVIPVVITVTIVVLFFFLISAVRIAFCKCGGGDQCHCQGGRKNCLFHTRTSFGAA
jgi:hypothetical protein